MRNIPLLEATMTQIKDHPELHRQESIFADADCGTAGCFAGWACLLNGYTRQGHGAVRTADGIVSGWFAAQDALGLNHNEALVLFSSGNTRSMLELMVKDLVNGEALKTEGHYMREVKK